MKTFLRSVDSCATPPFRLITFVSSIFCYNYCFRFIQDFSNTVHNDKIQQFAENDVHNVVNQVQEVFADFQAINEDLFSLDVGSTLSLSLHSASNWSQQDHLTANRIIDGLFGLLMATRTNPIIRYEGNSALCRYIAEKTQAKMNEEREFVNRMSRNSLTTHLLIMDRKEDPVTPLLNQWTY